jgi:hypothetical protein
MRQPLRTLSIALALLLAFSAPRLRAQAPDGTLTEKEIDSLRDAAYIPNDRVVTYEQILNDREREMKDLLAKPHHVSFSSDMHDLITQFGAIADELNDNLDEYQTHRRDVRKALPKLLSAIARWSDTLRAAPEDDAYNVVRRIALDSLKDMSGIATSMQTEQAAYFKAHPDEAKREQERADENHAPVPDESPR